MYNVRRPLATIGFSFLAASCITLTVPREYVYILLALLALLLPIHYFTAKRYTKHLSLILAVSLIATAYTITYNDTYQEKINAISTDKQNYSGYITQRSSMVAPASYTLQLVDTNTGKDTYAVKFFYTEELEIGDTVTVTGKFSKFKTSKYDFSAYFNNIKGNISALKVSPVDIKFSSYNRLTLAIKQKLLWKAKDLYSSKTEPLVWSMGYSDKTLLPYSYTDLFSAAGISHALVVSGFHVIILMSFLNMAVHYIPIHKKIKNVLVAIAVFIFMSIIGFSPSIVRAGVIAILALVLTNFKKSPDNITTLGLIVLITTVTSPYAARDIGLLLSYSACLGIIAGGNIVKDKALTSWQQGLVSTTAAIVFMMPVLSFSGMEVTILSPIFNLLLLPFISVICGLSFFTPIIACLGPIGKIINIIPVFINSVAMNFLLTALNLISDVFNFALINVGDKAILVICIGMAVGAAIGFIQFKNRKAIKLFAVTVALIGFLCYNSLNSNIITVTAFDSGREGSFLISSDAGNTLVLSEFSTAAKLKKRLAISNKTKYDDVVICSKEKLNTYAIEDIAENIVDMSLSKEYKNGHMKISSSITDKKKEYRMDISGVVIYFGHQKVAVLEQAGADFYFLGNDKPECACAQNIYIFGNTPKWMKIENIQELTSDLTIKINTKTGEYKIIKDVYNFGYEL
ncbi:MAG: ComEC/Rec2 family competence protein [Oscillospiraceae bacterium]